MGQIGHIGEVAGSKFFLKFAYNLFDNTNPSIYASLPYVLFDQYDLYDLYDMMS
jgi:hypothetical protein